ncbi:MAG: GNAT family N-acetyltransferase, partial [Balneolaceae bacterium]|nr:GNAT family N-acetyltransferase [Balneolaceae bacterium]
IVDMAVLPQHQGKGIGSAIMEELNRYIDQQLPPSAYISLIADGDAHHLYRKFGFDDVAPASRGMYRRVLSDLQ